MRNLIRNRLKIKTAFTLIELLLTITIIGLLLGISLPLLRKNIGNTRFKSAVNKIYLFLDYAKSHSTLKRTILIIKPGEDEKEMWITEKAVPEEPISEIKIPKEIEVTLDEETIIFYPDGTMQEFKINISDKDQRQATIWSKGFDGRIKLKGEQE